MLRGRLLMIFLGIEDPSACLIISVRLEIPTSMLCGELKVLLDTRLKFIELLISLQYLAQFALL